MFKITAILRRSKKLFFSLTTRPRILPKKPVCKISLDSSLVGILGTYKHTPHKQTFFPLKLSKRISLAWIAYPTIETRRVRSARCLKSAGSCGSFEELNTSSRISRVASKTINYSLWFYHIDYLAQSPLVELDNGEHFLKSTAPPSCVPRLKRRCTVVYNFSHT